MRDQVFISYSHGDKKLMEELLTHLKPHMRSGIKTWSDKQIAPGSQWFDEIQEGLSKTSVAVLLVSPSFLASDFIHEHEFGPLLKEAAAGGVRILWIPIRPSAFEETPLKKYQAVSPPERPLAEMSKAARDKAWVQICKEIKKAATSSTGTPVPSAPASPAPALGRGESAWKVDHSRPEAVPAEEDLLEELKRLPPAWFDELVFRLDTNSAVSGKHAPQAMRAMDLLTLVRVLEDGPARLRAEIQRLKKGRR